MSKTPAPKIARPKFLGIRIDIETRSGTEIKHGVYRYTEDPDFGVLKISYAPVRQYAGGAVRIGTPRPLALNHPSDVAKFCAILEDPGFQKHAFNANFERIALSAWMGKPPGTYLDPINWRCSAIQANTNGIFGTLDDVAKAVRSPIKKDAEGKRLINLFSKPDKKTGKFHSPCLRGAPCWCGADHRGDFEHFGRYCDNDVLTEAMAVSSLSPLSPEVQAEYEADQRINDRGFRHHRALSQAAVEQVAVEAERLRAELQMLTGVDNPNSIPQMKTWLEDQGYPMVSLDKAHRAEALADPSVPDIVARALTLKGAASLSSVQKHQAALNTRCSDGRIRGSLQFYGAHTGREAGRGIQPQNLPRAEATQKERVALLHGRAGTRAPEIAKGTVRASIVPAKDHVLVVADYNAIEARVLAGLAGEKTVEAEFKTGQGKIYELTASTMFSTPKATIVDALKQCDKCGVCAFCILRGKGKVSELALGYAGGAGALVTMGAAGAGIDVGNYPELNAEWKALGMPGKFFQWQPERHDYPELIKMRDLYRDSRPATVRFWKLCGIAWDKASAGGGARFGQDHMVSIIRDGAHNKMVLPSGRSIWYRYAKSHRDPENPEYVDRRTFIGKSSGIGHVRTDTHGGKLTENVTQAVARDFLFDLIMRIEAMTAAGWPGRIVLHVHDEVVVEVHKDHADQVLADTLGLMNQVPAWGSVFALKGEGKIMERYAK